MIRKPIYRIQFQNFEEFTVTITISDMEDYDPFLTEFYYVDLQGSDTPLKLVTGVNEEDSLYGIFTTQAVIQFEATDEIGMHTFLGGPMNKWRVLIDGPGFQGYLLADGMEEPFMRKRTTTLIAVQNLGLLRDIPLTGFSGERLSGRYSLGKLVAMCLYKAGLEIVINVADNLFEKEHEDRSVRSWNSPYDQTYVDVLTFEKEINELEDCYTVLEKILISRKSRLFIHNGEYWIVRVDEYINSTLTYTRFSYLGVISETENEPISVVKLIGNQARGFDVFPINEDAIVRASSRYKEVRLNYDYQFPKELIKNIDYTRGDFSSPLSGLGYTAYELEDWDKMDNYGTDAVASTNFNAYIKRVFDDFGYETERYMVVGQSSDSNTSDHIISQNVPICQEDKFKFSFDYKASVNPGRQNQTTIRLAAILLTADDGTYWVLGDNGDDPVWLQSNDTFTLNADFIQWVYAKTEEITENYSYDISAPAAPRTGDLSFLFFAPNQNAGTVADNFDLLISNISFTYTPFINGQYKVFSGERFTVSQSGNYAKKEDSKIYLADAPCKGYKGAMFRYLFPEGIEYSGLNITSSPNAIAVIGDTVSTKYFAGDKIKLTGTTLNDKIFTIQSVTILSTSHIEIYPVEDLETEVILGNTEISIGYLTLTEGWNDKIVNELSMTDERAVKWFLYDRFQQGRNVSNYFDFTLQGLDAGETNQCGIIHKYTIDISNPLTNNRFFLVLRFEQDWALCEWTASFVEGYYTANERTYGYDFTHKYIDQ